MCQRDTDGGSLSQEHEILDIDEDLELVAVAQWLREQNIRDRARVAVDDAVHYVLESQRTRRFTLADPDVDSDERASVGTKLQYRIIEQLGLKKQPPLDTVILDIAVEIKTTVRDNWMIPREGQCAVTMLIRVDALRNQFEVRLFRTHRAWLNAPNQDKKRGISKPALNRFSLVLVPPTDLPDEPLRRLNAEELDLVLGRGGLRQRLVHLFTILPGVVIPRNTITTVGAGLSDPMKRAREAKVALRNQGLVVLVGTWTDERELAGQLDFDISDEAWVAIDVEEFVARGLPVPSPR